MMVKVDSSMLNAIGYDDTTRKLTVEFSNGSVFEYSQVPRSIYDKVMEARSTGSAFNGLVKTKGYAYKKVKDAK
jgi:hypothetical protein